MEADKLHRRRGLSRYRFHYNPGFERQTHVRMFQGKRGLELGQRQGLAGVKWRGIASRLTKYVDGECSIRIRGLLLHYSMTTRV